MAEHTPGPWTWRDAAGAGLQISATLPAGFKFDGTAREADGKRSSLIWTVREAYTVQIADERWVQFSTGSWEEMQKANANLIVAAPDLLEAAEMLEAAELGRQDCEECDGEGEPEACGTCFPAFDDARVKRRLAIEKARGRPSPQPGVDREPEYLRQRRDHPNE